MRPKEIKGFAVLAVVLAVGFTAVSFLSSFVNANRITLPESYSDTDLSFQAGKLKGFALGSEGMIADWYWMRSLQYMGHKIVNAPGDINIENLSSLNPRLLYPMLNTATDLDPKFMSAYSYGAIVLPAIDRKQAVALTEKGIANNPESWRLYQYLGYIYWRAKDFDKAAEVYEAGSRISGAPPFFRQMVAAMRTQGGSRETARQLYSQMRDSSDDEQSRQNAELRLMQIDALDELDVINSALKKASAEGGKCPSSLSAILPQLLNVSLPNGRDLRVDQQRQLVDPTGVPYALDGAACKATIDGIRSKIPS